MLSRLASLLIKRSSPRQTSCPRLLHSAYRYRSHVPRSSWCVDRYRSLQNDRHPFAPRFMSTQASVNVLLRVLRIPKIILRELKDLLVQSFWSQPLQTIIFLILCAVVLFADRSDAADKLRAYNDHRTRLIMSNIVYLLVSDNVIPSTADASDLRITCQEHLKLTVESERGVVDELRGDGNESTEWTLKRWRRFRDVLLSINEKHMFSSNRATGLSKAEREAHEMRAQLQRRVKEERYVIGYMCVLLLIVMCSHDKTCPLPRISKCLLYHTCYLISFLMSPQRAPWPIPLSSLP